MKTIHCMAALLAVALSGSMMQPAVAHTMAPLYDDPVTLNGHPVDYFTFSLHTRGVIGLREDNRVSEQQRPIPFRLYLRRKGAIIRQASSTEAGDTYAVQLDTIMPYARYGDELVLVPTRPADLRSKRTIKLNSSNLFVFSFGPGC
jgi:hypothetical protein